VVRDPPVSYLVESPDKQVDHIMRKEGASLRVVVPHGADAWGKGTHLCSAWLGHRDCELDLRSHPEYGVFIGSKWAMEFPTATLLSPGIVAPNARAFWNAHLSTGLAGARVERWNAVVDQGGSPCWMRKYKVTERTIREGDNCCVIGEVRRTAEGELELHCGARGLLITNTSRAARPGTDTST